MKRYDTTTAAAAAVAKVTLQALTKEEREQFYTLSSKLVDEYEAIKNSKTDLTRIAALKAAIEMDVVDSKKIDDVKKEIRELETNKITAAAAVSKAGHQMAMLGALATAVASADKIV